MRHRPFLSAMAYLVVLITAPGALAAQSQATTGIIRGVVVDPDGAPISGATVVLTELQTNFTRSVTTGSDGAFAAPLLPIGTYDVTARAVGLQEATRRGLALRVGQSIDVTLRLGAAVALEALVVEAIEPVVDPSRSESATRLPEAATEGLPNNGRNFLDLTTLTPHVAIVQGPDGDELTVSGQRGIHNNISVDGADFNNPFFGEQRGGQRPPFTFNLDAVEEIVVIANGANAEFGRSSGGFVNVITKSGTNEFHGSVHYFGKYDPLAETAQHVCAGPGGICAAAGQTITRDPEFGQHQFGLTLGGPLVRDKAFFFIAYDQQVLNDTRQQDPTRIDARLRAWMDTAFGGALANDYGQIERTDNARAFMAKFDLRLSDRHNASLKYNYTWSQQENGTFDVDTWGRSANGLEKDFSHAVNGMLSSVLSSRLTNEFRFQLSREDRPRPYIGPTIPGVSSPPGVEENGGPAERPFPDIAMDFANGYRLGMPFFLPIAYYDSRIQLLDNVSLAVGRHLFKAGVEWNRVESVQTFIGFANGRFIFNSVDGFLNYVANGSGYRECSDGSTSLDGTCPPGTSVTGPVLLYLQQAGVGDNTVAEAGTQDIPQHELAAFIQDSWKPHPNLTLNYGLRWEASIQPDVRTPPDEVFFAPFIGQTQGGQEFPSDGTIPSDYDNFQPRFGFAWDVQGDNTTVIRGTAGVYYARIPGLNLASTRSTNGSLGQTLAGGAFVFNFPTPAIDSLLPQPTGPAIFPTVYVFDKDFENPRTISATIGLEQEVAEGTAASLTYTHARTDGLTRFVDRNGAEFGSPWSCCLEPDFDGDGVGDNGIFQLWTVESTAKSRYHGVTFGLRRMIDPVQFQINYTLSWDKSDDDNERDPFTLRYYDATQLEREFNWSDRDQRHRLNAWALIRLPADIFINNRVSAYSAQPVTLKCSGPNAGQRASSLRDDPDRVCPDGSILKRNTGRKDNAFFSWDLRLSRMFRIGATGGLELIAEVFNVTNSDNFLDPAFATLLFNFDGTVQSGLGAPRQVQVGARYVF